MHMAEDRTDSTTIYLGLIAVARLDPQSVPEAAVLYAEHGVPVFPCKEDKSPYTPTGFRAATTDVDQVRAWWARWPDALIGSPTGKVVVLDLDVRAHLNGLDTWARLCKEAGPIPETLTSLTPQGGMHLCFRSRNHYVRNSASELGPGVDVRGWGGYRILPPSRLLDGRSWQWEASSPMVLADLPAAIWRRLSDSAATTSGTVSSSSTEPSSAREGQRNHHLASVTGRLANSGLSLQQVRVMVRAENLRACHPPLSEEEIERTVLQSARKWIIAGGGEPEEGALEIPFIGAADWMADVKPPEWVIKDYLERGTLNIRIGGWGSGKSAIEMDLALRVVHGLPWQGIPVEQGLWVYVVGEGQRGFQRRIAAWHQHYELEPSNRLVVIPEAVLVGQPNSTLAFRHTLERVQDQHGRPITGVSLDTLARCFGLPDESSNSDMARFTGAIQEHVIVPFGPAVNALHHPGHGAKERGRGASALPGAADMEWLVEKNGNAVSMRNLKNKDGDSTAIMRWRLFGETVVLGGEPVSVVCVEEIDPAEHVEALKPGSKQELVLQVLREMYREARENLLETGRNPADAGVDKQALRERLSERFTDLSLKGISRQAVDNLLTELRKKGHIFFDGSFIHVALF